MSRMNPLVWYGAYGSNMDAARFACYIQGGKPAGGKRLHVGCDDKTPPLATRALELPQSLYFAEESPVWTGGVAFINHSAGSNPTKVKAYLITLRQFEQVAAQEDRRDIASRINLAALRQLKHISLGEGEGRYGEILYCGEHDGYPIVTVTSSKPLRPYTKPAPVYLRMIISSLRETHKLSTAQIVSYLIKKPGIAGNYTTSQISIMASATLEYANKKF